MAAPPFMKIMIIYLSIGLLLTLVGGPVGAGINNEISESFINQSTGDLSSDLKNVKPNLDEQSGAIEGVLNFIDGLRAVRGVLKFLGSLVFALPMVLFDLQIPSFVVILVGAPMAVIALIAFIYLIRSGN